MQGEVAAGCGDREHSEDTRFLCQDESLRAVQQIQKCGGKQGSKQIEADMKG